jgi:hypothetical protein
MPALRQRIDVASVTTSFLTLPKAKKRGSAVGFCGDEPVATVEGAASSSPPFRWVNGRPEPVTYQEVKKLGANGTSGAQIAGVWYTPKGDERALVWTRHDSGTLSGVELHPQKWEKSSALACGDGQQIGYGYVNFAEDPCRAVCWSGTRDSMVVLTGPDPSWESMGKGVAEGVQVGYVGGSGRQRACLWRGTTESYVDLHPPAKEIIGSEALGAADGQQVGQIWDDEMMGRAALWSGSPDSYVNLSPAGFMRSRASRCARGLQVGWVCREERGMLLRAVLWNGSADDFIDLQDALPSPWNASWAVDLDIVGDRLLILGTAQQAVRRGGYEVDAGKLPVIWEMKLLIAESPSRGDARVVVGATAAAGAAAVEVGAEQRVEKAGADFAQAVIAGDFEAAHNLLAPWLQQQVTAKELQTILSKELIDGIVAAEFEISGNDSTLDDLRRHYRESHKNDRARTLTTTEKFGAYGPPSIYIADEITPANFRQWMAIEFTPEPDDESGLDYCLRLWLIVVEVNGEMKIGHLEPGE